MSYCVEKQTMACMAWVTHCYMQIEESLDKCKPADQLILKDRIFDMLDRVKFLLDKKYEPNPKGHTDNPNTIKGVIIMRTELEKARRHAENTLAEVNRHLDRGNITNPHHHQMLTDMAEKATRTLENLNRLNNHHPYSDTNIGYRTDARRMRSDRTADDVADMVHTAMDAVDRIIPHLDDRYADDDDMDDRRGRPRTTRRGVGRWTQVRRHVRRMPRRSEMDDMRYADMDDHYDMDDRYDRYDDDDRYDLDDRRGVPGTGRYSRRRSRRSEADMDDRYERMDDRTDRYDTRSTNDNRGDRSNRSNRTSDTNPVDDRYNDNRSDNRYDDRSDDNRSIGPRG